MQYKKLADLYDRITATTKRLEKTVIVGDFLKENPSAIELIYLIQGKVFANWDKRKLGVASKLLIKALSLASGTSAEKIEDRWREVGDIGEVAAQLMAKRKQATLFSQPLTVTKVMSNLEKLADQEGQGTVNTKVKLVAELLTNASGSEAKYIIRSIIGDMRTGLGEGVMRDALVWAYLQDVLKLSYDQSANKLNIATSREEYNDACAAVDEAFHLTNDFQEVAKALHDKGLSGLKDIGLVPGKPMKVMLYPKCEGIEEAIRTVGTPLACEYKFDGFRLQIHKDHDKVTMFTRRLEEVSHQFPDIKKAVLESIKADFAILDCEAVGVDPKSKKYLPFQNISQRIKRKYDIAALAEQYPVEVDVFDILYLDGKNTTNLPLSERRRLLERAVKNTAMMKVIDQVVTDDPHTIQEYYEQALASGNEGLMLKSLSGEYKPGKRVGYGVKLKPVMETLDLVIVGGEWGEGKRSSWISSFIVACRDEDTDELLEIGRVATGLKEKDEEGFSFGQITELLKPLIIEEKGKNVRVSPGVIIEVAFEEIQKSPTYSSGFALRFPRFLRLRSDRNVEDISDIHLIKDMYDKQRGRS